MSDKCSKCGSLEHTYDDCPHGFLSDKCSKCGSLNHSTDNCPQGFFASPANKKYSQSNSETDSGVTLIIYLVIGIFALAIVIFIALIALYLSPFVLLIWYLITKRTNMWLAIGSVTLASYIIYDILSFGFLSQNALNFGSDANLVSLVYFNFSYSINYWLINHIKLRILQNTLVQLLNT